MIRQPNKEKRVEFCQKLILDNDNFDNIIWTDECTIQLHDNKVVIYRPIDVYNIVDKKFFSQDAVEERDLCGSSSADTSPYMDL
jgi:major membrane immunogen (membrane-anchored lipoprotein)